MKNWYSKLQDRKKINKKSNIKKNINPSIIPRNHIIESLLNDLDMDKLKNVNTFIKYLENPYSDNIPEKYTREPEIGERVHQTFCGT